MTYRIDFAVLSETQGQGCRFALTLHNLSDQNIEHWTLGFALERLIYPDSLSNGSIQQIGSFCVLTPDQPLLAANSHFYCEFTLRTSAFHFYNEGITAAFIELSNTDPVQRYEVITTPIVLASPFTERSQVPNVNASSLPLIPQPNQLTLDKGFFELTSEVGFYHTTELAQDSLNWLMEELEALYQFKQSKAHQKLVHYQLNPLLEKEHYKLEIHAQGILVEAAHPSGFMHASATLIQLAQKHTSGLRFPCLTIQDAPRFNYRGVMLDCARHFHPIEQVKRLINQLAHYKFNQFHWHLTDDEGWRIEIKAFPELTQIGAWRGLEETLEPQYTTLTEKHGGYYTQEQIKEVIVYAQQRGITVIPEIDIPGHSRAAIKALPELLVDPEDTSEYRSIQYYNDNILNPALTGTYQFIDAVLEEVAQLFPSPYVHIGADEVPEGVWINSPKCQALMAEQGYQDPKELQGHLLRHAENKLRSLGKRMLGWEEAQHGNKVSKDTVIYSWLSENAALNCAKQGFDVVLQPGQYTYLDIVQDYAPEELGVCWAGVTPLEKAYSYEPLAEVPEDNPLRKRILGIQCALWCEYINHLERIDYMLYPRITALSETGWTHKAHKDWLHYLARLKGHLPLLDQQGIHYRDPWQ